LGRCWVVAPWLASAPAPTYLLATRISHQYTESLASATSWNQQGDRGAPLTATLDAEKTIPMLYLLRATRAYPPSAGHPSTIERLCRDDPSRRVIGGRGSLFGYVLSSISKRRTAFSIRHGVSGIRQEVARGRAHKFSLSGKYRGRAKARESQPCQPTRVQRSGSREQPSSKVNSQQTGGAMPPRRDNKQPPKVPSQTAESLVRLEAAGGLHQPVTAQKLA
jgi:hypothetical protein